MDIPAKLPKGLLVAIEGIDGAGKSTQVELLADRFHYGGLAVVRTQEPTDGPYGRKIRESAKTGRMSPQDELDAFVEDRKQHVAELIGPALADGKIVIVDRYYYSTAAYQGARGLDFDEIIALNEAFAPKPDLLVILEVPTDLGLGRVETRGDQPDLFEETAYLEKVARLFRRIPAGDHVARLDGRADPQDVHKQIVRHLKPILRAHSGANHVLLPTLLG